MGYKIGFEPTWQRTTMEKVSRLDDALSKRLSPQNLSGWRKHDRQQFIDFGKKNPTVNEWRVMKRAPENWIETITGQFVDAYLVKQRNSTGNYVLKLYVITKEVGS